MSTLTLTQPKAHLIEHVCTCINLFALNLLCWMMMFGMPPSQLITDAAIDEVRAADEERRAIRPGPKPIVYVSKPPPPPKPASAPEQPKHQQHNHNSIYGFKNSGWVTRRRTFPYKRAHQYCTNKLCQSSPHLSLETRKLQYHHGYLQKLLT